MSKLKKVLASAFAVVILTTLAVPATVSAKPKTYGQCQSCKQGIMTYVGTSPLVEMVGILEYKYETRYGPHGQYTQLVEYQYRYEYDYYRCSHCGSQKRVRDKVLIRKRDVDKKMLG